MTTPDERVGNPPVDILWILAHPDDESFGSAGLMAWARDNGLRTAYVCATRGEAGGIRDPKLATRDSLGAVREQELRAAMSHVGLGELRMLGYRDSGMENTPENKHPMALINQPPEALLAHLVGHIRDLRPHTVITFGPEGIYGHPDHILTGKIAMRAIELANDPSWLPAMHATWQTQAVYFSAVPRTLINQMAEHPDQPLGEISDASRQNLGTPEDQITHWLDMSPWLEDKRRALACHSTQTDPEAILDPSESPAEVPNMGVEYYTRQPLPWDRTMSADDPLTRAREEVGSSEAHRSSALS